MAEEQILNESGTRPFFGEWLVKKGHLTHRKLCEALSAQHQYGGRLGEVLLRLKMLDDESITQSLADYLGLEYMRLNNPADIDMAIAKIVPEKIAKRFSLVGIQEDEDVIVIAMADPLNVVAIDTITLKLKRKIKILVSSANDIHEAIEMIYHGSHIDEQKLRDLVELQIDEDEEIVYEEIDIMEANIGSEDDTEDAGKAPVIRFVDLLLGQVVKRRASDVHLEPQENSMLIRMRVDGVLRETVPPPRKMRSSVITRIKILSGMNIAERRLPQDGRFKIKAPDRDIDVRASSLPTIYGEKIVMRILDQKTTSHNLDRLGFETGFLHEFKRALKQPYGIIIVTGPTGCGKTTTLYSALNYLRDPTKNITTVEDPVEYRLKGINQVQIKSNIELTFAKALRTILRQDPDIILIGEIRDKETAEIAIQASLTGHLVLTTFHTNDAASAITRLIHMGIEPYLIGSSLNLVVAQRLVRKTCDNCKEPTILNEDILQKLHLDPQQANLHTFYHARGCKACDGTGYQGRMPIFELFSMDDAIRKAILGNASEMEIRELARSIGGGSLLESGTRRILEKLTTADEVLKATYSGTTELLL